VYFNSRQAGQLSKKIQMPGSARAGLALLVVGAIFVGIGTYLKRGGFSLYGLIMAIAGFSIYMVSSVVIAKDRSRKSRNK
jgi:membrane-bound ClpP family serine protease